jgi:hypothetical protein
MRGLVLAMVLAPVVIDERPLPTRLAARDLQRLLDEPLRARPPLVLRKPRYQMELIPLWEGPPPVIPIPTEWPPLEPEPLRP